MATDLYMVMFDQSGKQLLGESLATVFDPYVGKNVVKPSEVYSINGETEQQYTIGSQTGSGAGKVIFDPFEVTRPVDVLTSTLFIAQASGLLLRYVDLLFVKADPSGSGGVAKPFLSYRLGTVGITDLAVASSDESPTETIKFDYGQLQIGYQVQKADGTYSTFAPVGWDRVRNIKI